MCISNLCCIYVIFVNIAMFMIELRLFHMYIHFTFFVYMEGSTTLCGRRWIAVNGSWRDHGDALPALA